ncbi:MAG: exodeoxyribonuclease III [Verrucomicrobiae bacterium]|nr:exodeoxyribonuclease III [Verrucomicrobiae bacterium]
MKLISWNVNGIRAVLKKGFLDFLAAEQPDLILLQEVKAEPGQVDHDFAAEGWEVQWNSAQKKGYSGVATLSRVPSLSVRHGIGLPGHDDEGRVLTTEYPGFFVVNVYTPNSQDDLRRLPYRMQWDAVFLEFVKDLEKTKPVIFAGDLNVAHREIDLARPKQNRKSAGFTDEERAGFDQIVAAGFVDTFRHFHPDEPDHYTWWSYRGGAREKNVGWRIDYFCVSAPLIERVSAARILPGVLGSDHCPVVVEVE